MSPVPPTSLAALADAVDQGHAHLRLLVASNGHGAIYDTALQNLRAIMAAMHNVIDNRATGQFPRIERERRETPTDPEAATPMRELPSKPVVEHRRRRTRDDEDR